MTFTSEDDDIDFERYSGFRGERMPVGQLSPQDWMAWPETQAVIAALQADGQAVRFVGGCVRDSLCGRPVRDIDIATADTPDRVIELLERASLKAIPTGIAHGTITALAGQRTFEITTLRRDVQTDGRHAVVEWTDDWREDAARRDFTINALSARPDGAVYDYFNGLEHLAHGRVRFIGRPDDRIAEDALRILRYFRFFAWYGAGNPHRPALAACQTAIASVATLSGERVQAEMLKILAADLAADVLLLMQGIRFFEVILPEMRNFGRLRQVVFLETRGLKLDGIATAPLRRLAATLDGGREAADRVADQLRLSTGARQRLVLAADTRPEIAIHNMELLWHPDGKTTNSPEPSPQPVQKMAEPPETAPATVRPRSSGPYHDMFGEDSPAVLRLWKQWGSAGMVDRLLLAWAGWRAADGRTHSRLTARLVALLDYFLHHTPPALPVRGADLLALGVAPGPQVGAWLAEAETWWLLQGAHGTREVVLAWLAERVVVRCPALSDEPA